MSPERRRQVEELYHAALQREPHVRAQFLNECGERDQELRREVESLLAQQVPGPGTQIGAYRLQTVLGRGGMGVVYQAFDTKLNRPVALKFLSDDLADAAARRRFQREAQMASSLNHPHILTVHDAGEFSGRQFLVTEFVDGGTLNDWVRAKQRSWREIVELLAGVADALATAHAAGILHRDIKPANILVGKSGYAKLADFGLAKLMDATGPDAETRTLSAQSTVPGVIQGTISYMSPEQACGAPIDSRSDIFSFAIVLYEMLAGRRPFDGATNLETLQQIIHADAPALGNDIPRGLRMVIDKSLEKSPDERYQSMREVTVDLRRLNRQSGDPAKVLANGRTRLRWTWIAAAAVLSAVSLLGWWVLRAPERSEPLQAVAVTTEQGVHRYPSFSPEGNHLTYTWTGPRQDNTDIYVQQVETGAPLRLTQDPKNDYGPAWSPDGRWIAFLRLQADGTSELRLIPPLGGTERKLAEIAVREVFVTAPYLAWCADSSCLVVTDSLGSGRPLALFVVSLDTGEKRQLTYPNPPAAGDAHPAVAPDGSSIVFRRCPSGIFSGELYRLKLGPGMTAIGEPDRLTSATLDANYPVWMPSGKEIVFSARGNLWRLAIASGSKPIRLPFIGDDGIMPVVSRPQPGHAPRLAYVRSFADMNIWRIETRAAGAPGSPPVQAISSTRREGMVQLSPDGRRVAFFSDRTGPGGIWVAHLDGGNAIQIAAMHAFGTGYPHWSPDGRNVVFHSNAGGQADVYVVSATGGKPRNLTSHPARESFPCYSRDGKWIYFTSNRTGADRVWKIPAGGGDAVMVTDTVGFMPVESPDGAYLYYVDSVFSPGGLWRRPVAGGAAVEIVDGIVLGNFVVLENGIYYVDSPSGRKWIYWIDRPAGETRLQYFDFATQRSTTVAGNLGSVDAVLAATPDGRTVLFSRVDSSIDDVMLVENFR